MTFSVSQSRQVAEPEPDSRCAIYQGPFSKNVGITKPRKPIFFLDNTTGKALSKIASSTLETKLSEPPLFLQNSALPLTPVMGSALYILGNWAHIYIFVTPHLGQVLEYQCPMHCSAMREMLHKSAAYHNSH